MSRKPASPLPRAGQAANYAFMSKAFTKEPESDTEFEDEIPELPAGIKNYITPEGLLRLREEFRVLQQEERPKIVETVSWAAGNGDRSENGDYIYGKRRLREIDRRMGFLKRRLRAAEVVRPDGKRRGAVFFGAYVTVEDEKGEEHCYQIVGTDEVDAAAGRLSWKSPVGRTLLGKKVDDTVVVKWAGGRRELTITAIRYEDPKKGAP